MVASIVATSRRPRSDSPYASPRTIVSIRPALSTRPSATNLSPFAGRSKFTLNSTLSTSDSGGIHACVKHTALLRQLPPEFQSDVDATAFHLHEARSYQRHQPLLCEARSYSVQRIIRILCHAKIVSSTFPLWPAAQRSAPQSRAQHSRPAEW
jgi:hypothetical protein